MSGEPSPSFDLIVASALFSAIFIYGVIGYVFWRRFTQLDREYENLKDARTRFDSDKLRKP